MRITYIEESFPRYFICSEHANGLVDVCSIDEIIATVSKEQAISLIEDRDAVLDRLTTLALRFADIAPSEFSKIWYDVKL